MEDLKIRQSSWLLTSGHLQAWSWSPLVGNSQFCCVLDRVERPGLWYHHKHYI